MPLEVTATDAAPAGHGRPAATSSEAIPARLGRYRLERVLGAGGMGVVYRAFDPELARHIAIKVLRPGERDGQARLRLLREARAMAQISHPNVVTVHEVGTDAGHDFIVMELVEGTTLTRWLRDGRASRARIIEAFIAAGRGLVAAHHAGMIHRDFKPDNVLRTFDGRITVGDFGLARAPATLPNGLPAPRGSGPAITNAAGIAGTPAYMAPEQWRCDEITPAVDQWAFCVALWEALTGSRPFDPITLETLATARWELPVRADLPRSIRAVIARGLAVDPAKRWPDLETLLDQLPIGQSSTANVVGAFAVVGVLGGLTLGLGGFGSSSTEAFTCGEAPAAGPSGTLADPRVAWVLDEDARRTSELRARACIAEIPSAHHVACLDGVHARQVAVRRAAARLPIGAVDVGGLLVDPAVCSANNPPRLQPTWSEASIDPFVALLGVHLPDKTKRGPTPFHITTAVDGTSELARSYASDPCAQAIGMLTVARDDQAAAHTASALAQLCGDDRVIADAELVVLRHRVERDRFRVIEHGLVRTTDAVQRVAQPDLLGALALERARYAGFRGATAERLRFLDQAIEQLGTRRPAQRLAIVRERVGANVPVDDTAHLKNELVVDRAHHIHQAHGGTDHDHAHPHPHGEHEAHDSH